MKLFYTFFLILNFICYSQMSSYFNPFISKDSHLKLVVVIPSFNNADFFLKNIESVVKQVLNKDFTFSVIFIDDCSTDETGLLIDKYVLDNNLQSLIKVIHNRERVGSLANLYTTIQSLPDDVIVVLVDGDDYLPHNQVLARIAQEYLNKNIWFAYSKMMYVSGVESEPDHFFGKEFPSNIIKNRRFRLYEWITRHIKTFYAGLFKNIELEDLLHTDHKFFSMAGDFAVVFPLLEMASNNHISFIPEVLYIYNDLNLKSDHYIDFDLQLSLGQYIRNKKIYDPLLYDEDIKGQLTADLVVFSYDRPLQLFAFLESVEKYITGLGEIHVIYRTSSQEYENAYLKVKARFSNVFFHLQGEQNPSKDFKDLTLQSAFKSPSDYILFAVDDIIVKDYIDIAHDITLLQDTNAYGFYYRLGTHLNHCHPTNKVQSLPDLKNITDEVLSWSFESAEGDWGYPNTVDMTLYEKITIKKDIESIPLENPSFEFFWDNLSSKIKYKIGLCYQISKIVNIPLNRVQDVCSNPHMGISKEYLLSIFNLGLKIDINPLFRNKNSGAHTEYQLSYIVRT